ncbi:energy-coupling factor transporter ATPase [Anaerobacillus alkalidiazotrophicus]|uniref:Energy-coupling factor transporter ATPase n=1 Tax=Anaerobacillus alkalidiazotrophicus TaxID=472963 RepID=A0A1S2MCT7_9BACI|nr:energy-coupling factor ABC transporter ATP-binding protein [Anaerobacillus alkalidiazotrophicus]OIJ21647.1 energy-coupling factor transporter ATPase [Anaerobacillus alkalidiazotrophicus]
MSNTLIRINGLSFKYDEESLNVLNNIHMQVCKGEWVSIVGHNGSGKSTLAKFLNGLLIPTQPNIVTVEDLDSYDEEIVWKVRNKVGMVFQNPDNQMVATTVRDDVAFGLENIGIKREEMLNRIDWAIQKVKMENYLEHEPHRLSGGQKQRVAIAGIIAMRPSVLILDEATSMLDPMGRKEVLDTVWKLNKEEGMTVINITHDLEETVLSDKIIVMNKGEISTYGSPKEVFAQGEKLVEAGLDLPFSLQIQQLIKEKGYNIPTACLTKKELVNELWRLQSKT